jgi:adenylate cyclase
MPDSDHTVFYRPNRPQAGAAGGRGLLWLLEHHRLARAALIGLLAAGAALAAGRTWFAERESELIEIVDYDQRTIEGLCADRRLPRFGLWPRTYHQRLLEYLGRGGPRVVAFDVIFPHLGSPDLTDEEDLLFAEHCAKAGNIVHACNFFPSELEGPKALKAYPSPAGELADRLSLGSSTIHPSSLLRSYAGASPPPVFSGATWPYPALLGASRAVGSVQLETDPDSVTRRVSPAIGHAGRIWPTLSTAAAAVALGEKPTVGEAALTVRGQSFPLERGARLLRWYGPGEKHRGRDVPRYRTWPAHLLFDSETALRHNAEKPAEPSLPVPVDPARFKDKIVLVASNAPGSYDLRYTPFGHEPGVYIHAAAIESLLRGDAVRRAGGLWTALAAAGLALAAAFAFAVGSVRRSALVGSGTALLLGGAYAAAAFGLYGQRGLWIDLVVPLAALGLSLAGSLLAGYLVEGREARVMRRGLARFLSPEVLREIAGDLDSLRPGMGRKREITLMFCDARGFTGIAERLAPEAAVEVLDAYLGAMSDCILAEGGTLSKYIGDGIMAFWNAPADCPDHAQRAARSALAMVRAQEALKVRLGAAGRPAFDIGIGLHTGAAIVGTVGSEQRLDYTAIGDSVNLASRVEGLTKDFQVRICATGDFADRAGGRFEFRELGRVQVRNRTAGVEIMELVAERAGAAGEARRTAEDDPFAAQAAQGRQEELE